MRAQSFLVLEQLAVEFVGQQVYRGVHVLVYRVGKQVGAANMEIGLGFLLQLVDRECDVRIGDVVKMPRQSVEFARDVVAQRRSDFHVMARDVQLHGGFLIVFVDRMQMILA